MRRLGPALEVRDYRLWWLALMGMGISLQMLEVAIGWEVYAQHRSALDLGWIGLAEFVPLFVLALPAGQLADRVPRRLIFAGSLLVGAGVGVGLALVSGAGVTSVVPYLALAVGAGTAMALGTPAARAMSPTLVGPELLQSAMTLRSIATQSAQVIGPALGGVLYGTSPSLVYLLAAGVCLAASGIVMRMRPGEAAEVRDEVAPTRVATNLVEGLRFVRRSQILLGAILLDLLAVLFGGAVGLLPIFARSILHVGATGLGVLRAAPAVGALVGAAVITRRPIGRHAGRLLLTVVLLYGASIVVFGLSRFLSAVAGGAGGQRLRGPLQHEHPLHHGRAGQPRPASRARQRRRDGVHQRVQPAGVLRVRAGGRRWSARSPPSWGRGDDDADRAQLGKDLPRAGQGRPAGADPAIGRRGVRRRTRLNAQPQSCATLRG